MKFSWLNHQENYDKLHRQDAGGILSSLTASEERLVRYKGGRRMSVHEQEQMHINITLGNISRRIPGIQLSLDERERLLLGGAYDVFYGGLSKESRARIRSCFNRKDLSFYSQARQASETFFHTYFDENGQKRAGFSGLRSHISGFWKTQLSPS